MFRSRAIVSGLGGLHDDHAQESQGHRVHTLPSASLLKRVESAIIGRLGDLLDISEKPKAEKVKKLTEEEEQLRKIEREAIADFQGDMTQIEAALERLKYWWPRAESNHRHKDFQFCPVNLVR